MALRYYIIDITMTRNKNKIIRSVTIVDIFYLLKLKTFGPMIMQY